MTQFSPNRSALRISPIPFKPSLLSIPPSPFSPRTPLTPTAHKRPDPPSSSCYTCPRPPNVSYAPASPLQPLNWQWSCHQCAQAYPLSATRRCLEDGHHFCSGTTTAKTWRKPGGKRRVKKHRACTSSFDYSGWNAWLRWRRELLDQEAPTSSTTGTSQLQKDCWNTCSYPSECRRGNSHRVPIPPEASFPGVDMPDPVTISS